MHTHFLRVTHMLVGLCTCAHATPERASCACVHATHTWKRKEKRKKNLLVLLVKILFEEVSFKTNFEGKRWAVVESKTKREKIPDLCRKRVCLL